MRIFFSVFLWLLALPQTGWATDHGPTPDQQGWTPPPLRLSGDLSSLGAGAELFWQPLAHWSLRLGYSQGEFETDVVDKGYKCRCTLQLQSMGLMVDHYPFADRGIRLSIGTRYSKNKIDVDATREQSNSILTNLLGPRVIRGTVSVAPIAPMVTVGWRSNPRKPWMIAIDAGALFQLRPDADLYVASDDLSGLVVDGELENEEQETIRKLRYFRTYPVVSLTVGYKF